MSEQKYSKIAILPSADQKIDSALQKVNQGFDGGKISKADFVTWIVLNAIEHMNATMVENIRKAHFNQAVYLESLVRKLRLSKREKMSEDEIAALHSVLDGGVTKRRTLPKKIEVSPTTLKQP